LGRQLQEKGKNQREWEGIKGGAKTSTYNDKPNFLKKDVEG